MIGHVWRHHACFYEHDECLQAMYILCDIPAIRLDANWFVNIKAHLWVVDLCVLNQRIDPNQTFDL